MSDIDGWQFSNGYHNFYECKKFSSDDEIKIKVHHFWGHLDLTQKLNCATKWWGAFYYVGTDDNGRIGPDDYIWVITLDAYMKLQKPGDTRSDIYIHRKYMRKMTMKEFSWERNKELDLKVDPFDDTKDNTADKFKDFR